MNADRKISKRDFLKTCACGAAMLTLGGLSEKTEASSLLRRLMPESSPGPLWKWSKEMSYYTQTPRGLKCLVCPNGCVLTEGGPPSICKNKVVKNNKLYTIAYGNPCSVHVDPIEKKPLFHFLPDTTAYSLATAGCNFSCLNCQNWEISQTSPQKTVNIDQMPDAVVRECLSNACRSIAYTYSEPVAFFDYARDTARLAKARGLKNVWISNGFINEKPLRDVAQYLHAANINLKSFSDDIYARLNGGSLQPVLNTLKILKEMGVWVEVTNLIVPTWTDKPDMIKKMCGWLAANGFRDNPLHFNRFFPMYKLTNLPYTPLDFLEKARAIALGEGMKYVYVGNVPGTSSINTYCPKCKKVVVERKGYTTLQNNLKDGRCKFCSTPIAGVWK
ncbi:MAG TPA: AmmeMemoRadiSam system radical SAM enzyme [Bacteroidales bacterium]|nr:AmmeMemoRadiSam system radical SAM enzyme [Bacteroidales bacterium]